MNGAPSIAAGPSSRLIRALAIALATSSGLLAVVAIAAGSSGSTGLAGLASAGAMIASAIGFAAWRSAQRLGAHHDELRRSVEELESSRRRFRQAVAQLGAVARLRDAEAGGRDREKNLEHDREEILRVVSETALLAVGADRVVFFEFVPAPDRLIARSGIGAPVGAVLSAGVGLAGAVVTTRAPALYPGDAEPAPPEPERPTGMAVPFLSRRDLLGVVAVYGRAAPEDTTPFGPDDLDALNTLVTQAGTAVDNVSLHEEAQRLSITDGLTGLWNRRQLELRCQEEIERAIRFSRTVGVVFCDIDRFKSINDDPEWLYPGGDAVLVEVAQRLAAATREIDVVARWGGEEFVLLLPETDLGGALVLAEKVRRAVADAPVVHAGKSRAVTISLGVASFPHSGTNVRTLLNAAGEALHRAKHSGRNRIEQAEPKIRGAPPAADRGGEREQGPQSGDPGSGARDALPPRHEEPAEGDAAGHRQADDPIRGRGSGTGGD